MTLYRTSEASKILGIDRHWFKTLRETGIFETRQIGKAFRFTSEELNAFKLATSGMILRNENDLRALAPEIIARMQRKRS